MSETTVELRIDCERSKKILARVTTKGMKLWCEKHRREELITWQQIDALRSSLVVHTSTVIQ